MTSLRRRVLRSYPTASPGPRRQRQREQLTKERANLDRWMAWLWRAFHAVEK